MLNYKFIKGSNGFTIQECMIALIIITIAILGLGNVAVTVIKNSRFSQKLLDTNILVSQKSSQLFNDINNQVSKIPAGQTSIGSINPEQKVNGYYDLLNESGCLLNVVQPTIKPLGGIKNPLGGIGTDPNDGRVVGIDCSTSTYTNPSTSLVPKVRRQWVVLKDFPNKNDLSVSIVIIYQQSNQIVQLKTVTKPDTLTIK